MVAVVVVSERVEARSAGGGERYDISWFMVFTAATKIRGERLRPGLHVEFGSPME